MIIAGAGPIGLACAISAKRRGLDPLVIDAGALANSIVHYPINMTFFTTPERLEIGNHPLVCAGQKATREEALKYYRGVARAEGLRVRTYTKLVDKNSVQTRLGRETISYDKLVLATGYFDSPNRLGVPGEEMPHVHHYFDDAHLSYGLDVVVIGGKNSAAEASLELFRGGAHVTLVHRHPTLGDSIKYWVRPDIENRIKEGSIAARFNACVREITRTTVVIDHQGTREEIPAEGVFLLTGYHPDIDLMRTAGIHVDDVTLAPELNMETFETNVPNMFIAGGAIAGKKTGNIFIENGRFHGGKIIDALAQRLGD